LPRRHGSLRSAAVRERAGNHTALFALVTLVSLPLLLAQPSPAVAAGVEAGADASFEGSAQTGPVFDADGCYPDLQPFEVAVMGNRPTADVALGVALRDEYAFVADGLGGLQVLDVREPTAPLQAGNYDTPGYAQGVTVRGDYAYVADGPGGLVILDVTDPRSPTLAGTCATDGFAYGVAVSGNYAFVGGGAAGLEVVDVSDPRSPVLVGCYDVCGTAWGVAVSGDYAFVAGGASGLHVVDIAFPTSPFLVASYDTRSMVIGVTVANGFAYLAGGTTGIQVLSIADPASPTLIARALSSDFAYGVSIRGNHVYVAGAANGLQIMQAKVSIALGGHPGSPPTGLSDPSAGAARSVLPRGSLLQNSPNPFSSETRIAFSVESAGPTSLKVFDATGRLVREISSRHLTPGRYVEHWDGRDESGRALPAGTYFCRLEGPGWADVKKMTLAR